MSFFMNLFSQYGIWAMFFLILLEYACFPVSSEIVLPFTGAFASAQQTSYLFILILSIIAGLIGTSICFFIGKTGGTLLINKIKKRFPKSEKSFQTCYEKFDRYGSTFVCISRVIPLCRTYVAFVAGAMNLSYTTFLIASFAGISVWNALLIGLGYTLKNNWGTVAFYYKEYKDIFLIIVIISAVSFLISRFRKKRRESQP